MSKFEKNVVEQDIEKLIEIRLVLMERHVSMLEQTLEFCDKEKDKGRFLDAVIRLFSWVKLDVLELFALYGLSRGVPNEDHQPLFTLLSNEEKEAICMCFQDKELDDAMDSLNMCKPDQWCKETRDYLKEHKDIFRNILCVIRQRLA